MDKELPGYFHRTYRRWYAWFSYFYDPFLKVLFFLSNGGFGGERRIRKRIIDCIDPRPGDRILDLCSGTGTLTVMIAERISGIGSVVGIDVSTAQLRVARKKEGLKGLTFIQGDAQDIGFPHNHFDKGVIFGALHEMPREVRLKVLSEAYRVLKPGGRMVFFEHNRPSNRWRAAMMDFFERFNPEYRTYKDMLEHGLTGEVEQAGFKIVTRETALHETNQIILAEK
jgi:ubiquinone/menaquinone biosynthesis C-methylase UbiE